VIYRDYISFIVLGGGDGGDRYDIYSCKMTEVVSSKYYFRVKIT